MESPFYKGRTEYGGASCFGQPFVSQPRPINAVKVQPVNEEDIKEHISLSKTANKILGILKGYSMPIIDATKIPHPNVSRTMRLAKARNPYMVKTQKSLHSELQVPTTPESIKLLKEKLQEGTVNMRQLAASSNCELNSQEYKLQSNDGHAHKNKIKTKLSITRRQRPLDESADFINLPDASLIISSLPNFNFNLDKCSSDIKPVELNYKEHHKNTTVGTSTEMNSVMESTEIIEDENKTKIISNRLETKRTETTTIERKVNADNTSFQFGKPDIIVDKPQLIKAINNFIFSEPISIKTNDEKSVFTGSIVNERDSCNNSSEEDNILECLAPTEQSWCCLICLQKNATETNKCKRCSIIRKDVKLVKQLSPNRKKASYDDYKFVSKGWPCKSCSLFNISERNKCYACNTPRNPSKDEIKSENELRNWECHDCNNKNGIPREICTVCKIPRQMNNGCLLNESLYEGFKLPSNTWTCHGCKIVNKGELLNCAACGFTNLPQPDKGVINKENDILNSKISNGTTAQPIAPKFNDIFIKKTDEWECPTCMIYNATSKCTCQCCGTQKPGSENVNNIPKEPLLPFCLGIWKNPPFTKKEIDKENDSTLDINKDSTLQMIVREKTTANLVTSDKPTFNFGIKPVEEKIELKEDQVSTTVATAIQNVEIITSKSNIKGNQDFDNSTGINVDSSTTQNVEIITTKSNITASFDFKNPIERKIDSSTCNNEQFIPSFVNGEDIVNINNVASTLFKIPQPVQQVTSNSSNFENESTSKVVTTAAQLFTFGIPTTTPVSIQSTTNMSYSSNRSIFDTNQTNVQVTLGQSTGSIFAAPITSTAVTFSFPSSNINNNIFKSDFMTKQASEKEPIKEQNKKIFGTLNSENKQKSPLFLNRVGNVPEGKSTAVPTFSFDQSKPSAGLMFGEFGNNKSSKDVEKTAGFNFAVDSTKSFNFGAGSNNPSVQNMALSQNGVFNFNATSASKTNNPYFGSLTQTSAVANNQPVFNFDKSDKKMVSYIFVIDLKYSFKSYLRITNLNVSLDFK